MKFSYNLISEYLSKKPPEAHKLAELLTLHSFEVEGIEKVGGDYIFDIDILPNRAHDAASHIGVARDVAAILSHGHGGAARRAMKLRQKTYPSLKRKKNTIKGLRVAVQRQALCPRYMSAIVQGVNVGASPAWLKKRLEALGINSINNIVDAANYAMLITGQPLHVFDHDKITGKKITVRNARKKETIDTLDEQAFILDDSVLVIADDKAPLAIAGVKGGKKAEVTNETKNIVIEAAHFDPLAVRHATKTLGLRTDASWRFEHEVPVSLVPAGLQTLIDLIQQLAGGQVEREVVDTLTKEPSGTVVPLQPSRLQQLLGTTIGKQHIKNILNALGFRVQNSSTDSLTVRVPEFRLDVTREEDVIEEIARIFGYQNIEPEMPAAALYPAEQNPKNYWLRHTRRHLASRGVSEVQTYAFLSRALLKAWRYARKDVWELSNPVSEEYTYLTPSLLPRMVETANRNLRFRDTVHIFEIADTFKRSRSETKRETTRLGLVTAFKRASADDLLDLKGEITDLLYSMGVTDVWFDDAFSEKEQSRLKFLHPARRAQIKVGNTLLGHFGQLHPRVAHEVNSAEGVFVGEINMEKLVTTAEEEETYRPASAYPHVVRDLSLIVPKYTKTSDVMEIISNTGGPLLVDVDLFDYYENPPSEREDEEITSMAFHLVFQAEDRTLTSKEVDGLMAKIEREVKSKGWEVK